MFGRVLRARAAFLILTNSFPWSLPFWSSRTPKKTRAKGRKKLQALPELQFYRAAATVPRRWSETTHLQLSHPSLVSNRSGNRRRDRVYLESFPGPRSTPKVLQRAAQSFRVLSCVVCRAFNPGKFRLLEEICGSRSQALKQQQTLGMWQAGPFKGAVSGASAKSGSSYRQKNT